MVSTQELIDLLINDNQIELNKLFINQKWKIDINFKEIYQAIIDNDNISSCQFMIGRIYKNGSGVEKDYEKALYWYQKSADQGHSTAQNNLGYMYHTGQGVDQNYEKTLYWYQLAANQGESSGQNNLGHMYKNGEGVEKDYGKALNWYQLSADQGNNIAQYNIGFMYQYGLGVDQDYEKALYWYQLAITDNNIIQARVKKMLKKFSNENLFEYIRKLQSKNQELEEENTELKYRPGGIGFKECKDRFENQKY